MTEATYELRLERIDEASVARSWHDRAIQEGDRDA